MKEIVYVHAGKLSNYTGTHFWNTQEAYIADESADSQYDFDVSFREGLSPTGRPTFCPRLLVLDRKANFGTLAQSNALLGADVEEAPSEDAPAIWNGEISEYRQDPIPKSTYHAGLDEADDHDNNNNNSAHNDAESSEAVRYWSDFNRVYYIPRTVQKLPDPPEWENPDGDWNYGQILFSQYDEDHALMEGALRLFLEECDSPQGIQIMNDTSTFGGFMNSFITSFRDQYGKLPCLVIPLLSDAVSRPLEIDDYTGTRKMISDALYLRSLNEMASMSMPIQAPQNWPRTAWSEHLNSETNNLYHDSAILSAHVETSTLSLRLKQAHSDLSTMCSQLNWRGTTPFCELSGVFPYYSAEDIDARLTNFSANQGQHNTTEHAQFTRLDVTRGFSPSGILAYDKWSAGQPLQDPFIARIHAASYPIPTSFPPFFKPSASHIRRGVLTQPVECSVFSSLSTSTGTAHLFSSHASAIEKYLQRKPAVEALGFDGDDLKDLANDLWALHANFDENGDDGDDGSLGEDES